MSEDNDVERELPATERKIQKAREEGNIPRSKDLAGALVVLVGLLGVSVLSGFLTDQNKQLMKSALTLSVADAKDPARMPVAFMELLLKALLVISPWLLAVAVAAVVGTLLVGGAVFVTKNLEPKFSKLNPISGLKNMFSAHAMFEFVKALVKALVIGGVAFGLVWMNVNEFPRMMTIPLPNAIELATALALKDAMVLALVFAVAVSPDAPYQIFRYLKQLRMNVEEIKREQKESEGDPHVKARVRQIQRDMSRRRMMASIPNADVIVTNPTHYAVALAYKDGKGAPRVVAKGVDLIAHQIRELGKTHHIAQIEVPHLARALYKHVDIDREIPPTLYTAVAKLLAYLYTMEQGQVDEAVFPGEQDIPLGMDPGPSPES
ncbi:MAG TPA: flagellar biosynthesis protein FlhB [Limnobacter sp.]|uniref:flagellar biosynthesis protein FlhB n=1 Tax=Limnobacter sp. TaxID=2003368 RepID=UPI002ED895A1